MNTGPQWDRCIYHLDREAEQFLAEHLGDNGRRIQLVGGAGFDPRSTIVAALIAKAAGQRVQGAFIREQRPSPDSQLTRKADENQSALQQIISRSEFCSLDIFAPDNAVVGGRHAVALVNGINLTGITDVVVDLSALSIGIAFPIIRYLHDLAQTRPLNLHLVVVDEPATDSVIRSTASEAPTTIHGFKGGWELDEHSDAARLWMPQLCLTKKAALDRIHRRVVPHAVCPILPFPASVPRLADTLIEHYGDLLQNPWQVDSRDVIYASERSPVDLYRTMLRIDDARRRVFAETGGSQTILSPVGSKALAIGSLMAALERDFTVMYLESLSYSVDFGEVEEIRQHDKSQLVHVWLHGEAYRATGMEEPSHEQK